MKERKPELLAPAGSMDSLKGAVHAGADAVYMGGSRFGARAYADNPADDRLPEAIDYAHRYGVKLYLTVNTLLKERELEGELYDYLKPSYEHGLDAVLVQDMGVLEAVKEWFPELPVHCSTQMTLGGSGSVRVLEEAGADRVVLPRELSLDEIARIRREVDIELECFVHGALCYCYSGQCLFSSILGGRSGNRGRCAQPCRLPYGAFSEGKLLSRADESALLSPKDLCALELIPALLEAGVCSLKIEGRMKRPEYVAGVVRIYRKYLDRYLAHGAEAFRVKEEDLRELSLLFNRDGFSQGYYDRHNGRELMALQNRQPTKQENREREALYASLREQYVETEKKLPVTGSFYAEAGQPMRLQVTNGHHMVTVSGDCAQAAKSRPMEEADIRRQLAKTGNTPFVWDTLQIRTEGALFVPTQALNRLRRDALDAFQEELKNPFLREALPPQGKKRTSAPSDKMAAARGLHISVETQEQLEAVLSGADALKAYAGCPLRCICLEAESLEEKLSELIGRIHGAGLLAWVTLPAVFRMETEERFRRQADFWTGLSTDGYVLRDVGEYAFLTELLFGKPWITDHNLYTFNRRAEDFWRKRGSFMQTNPLELNSRELREISGADRIQIIYGRYPMMTTAGCLHRTLGKCRKRAEQWMLRDRLGKEFPVKNHCRDCYNVIYNSQPLWLFDRMPEVYALHAGACRIMLTTETATETRAVLAGFLEERCAEGEFTRGHFRRGVE